MSKVLSIIAGIMMINSFYTPWYKFTGVSNISPLDVLNNYLSQPLTSDTLWKIASMIGILILGGLMVLTAIFPKLFLSVIKIIIAITLVSVHVGYFYSVIIEKGAPADWIQLINTSPGFLLFLAAMAIYFFTVLMAIIFSPIKGIGKLMGL
ncbi:MAG: hypothetical protein WCJ19_03350 [bacterium]